MKKMNSEAAEFWAAKFRVTDGDHNVPRFVVDNMLYSTDRRMAFRAKNDQGDLGNDVPLLYDWEHVRKTIDEVLAHPGRRVCGGLDPVFQYVDRVGGDVALERKREFAAWSLRWDKADTVECPCCGTNLRVFGGDSAWNDEDYDKYLAVFDFEPEMRPVKLAHAGSVVSFDAVRLVPIAKMYANFGGGIDIVDLDSGLKMLRLTGENFAAGVLGIRNPEYGESFDVEVAK